MMLEEQRWSLIEHEESDDVDHFIFKKIGTQSKVQYIATHMNRIIEADPPMDCASELQGDGAEDREFEREREKDVKGGGAKVSLHPENDEMVKDCKKLYERTVDDICKKKIQVTVLRANREIIDGIEVDMEVEVVGAVGKTTRHAPSCFFELYPNEKDASLLQNLQDPAETDPTEAEKRGMTATLRASSDLCKADEEDGKNILLETRPSMGYLGFYRGYEYVDAQLPKAKFAARDDLPQDIDLRKKYPKCFLQGGKEVIRSQGKCGSCWAFAAASALMNNLCTSNEDSPSSFADATDRYEVSVQQVLSCNAGKEGCDGAWAYTANQAFLDHGISRERDHPYQCGAGNPLHHFEGSGSCKKWPWGGKCAKDNVADWIYGGALTVKGEQDMLTLLSQGHALYMSMMVDDSFVFEDFTGKVYDGTNQYGSKGGHAMTGIGYGVQDSVKYWLVQNSWGVKWQGNGVIKIKRGVNLDGIDKGAVYFRGWVKGASEPKVECTDQVSWCSIVSKEECADGFYQIRCAVTCGTCGGPRAPVSQPTPLPTPAATSPTGSCDFLTPLSADGINNPLCSDGTRSWHCVTQDHGHRVQCPSIAPYMCAKKMCDGMTDHCCEASQEKCSPYGGLRLC